jgi:hypothetical protein
MATFILRALGWRPVKSSAPVAGTLEEFVELDGFGAWELVAPAEPEVAGTVLATPGALDPAAW